MTEMTIIQKLAHRCYADFCGEKRGKRLNRDVVAWWMGAHRALYVIDSPDADWVGRVTMLVIASRGFDEVEKIVRAEPLE